MWNLILNLGVTGGAGDKDREWGWSRAGLAAGGGLEAVRAGLGWAGLGLEVGLLF